ncbi:MAG: uL15 family ribosomal protein [Promethearchaeati archaeon SRVP18_Atabeyarchaeia-1]
MPPRFRRKVRRLRGSRTCGWGRVAQHRGSGHRGGYGNAGGHKHMWSRVNVETPGYFGKKGFRPRKFIVRPRTIDLEGISQALEGIPKKSEGTEKKMKINIVELGYEKVLGRGRIGKPINVEARSFSKIAKEKIESAGGKATVVA